MIQIAFLRQISLLPIIEKMMLFVFCKPVSHLKYKGDRKKEINLSPFSYAPVCLQTKKEISPYESN